VTFRLSGYGKTITFLTTLWVVIVEERLGMKDFKMKQSEHDF
jgi:hypothetical protein